VEDVEYRPQRRVGINSLIKACVATAVAAMLLSAGLQSRTATYVAVFPAAMAVAWFAAFAAHRRRRCRLTATGIESRHLRTRFIQWAQIRDVQVVERVTVAHIAVRGNRAAGRYGSSSGGGARKIASIRVQGANGRGRELAMPVVWENAPDPDFTRKAGVIQDHWRAATGRAPADAATTGRN
jgi:hypothetical protein